MKINEYLAQHCKIKEIFHGLSLRELAPGVVCKDGFGMSVQVGCTHYCSPRVNNAIYYSAVEIGFPSEKEDLLMPFAEDEEAPTKTVYGYVPVDIVNQVIQKHGGFRSEAP